MRFLIVSIFLLVTLVPSLVSANPIPIDSISPAKKEWDEFFGRNLKYPSEALRPRESAQVVISIKIGPEGTLDSLHLVEKASPYFNDQVLRVFDMASLFWKHEVLEGREFNASYQIVVNFIVSNTGGPPTDRKKIATNYILAGKPEKALKISEQLVKSNPYDYINYELRSQINRQLGNSEQAEKDLLSSQKVKNDVLSSFDVVIFSVVRSTSATGTIPSR